MMPEKKATRCEGRREDGGGRGREEEGGGGWRKEGGRRRRENQHICQQILFMIYDTNIPLYEVQP